jgi:8-oxo-dGTP pyrophosphatase MutT (NUDIX family)
MKDSRKSAWIQQHSAGGVVIRRVGECTQFLAIKPAHRDRWQLPKGTIDRGETSEQAALREVREEGGVDARILMPLGPIHFFYHMNGRRYSKTVDFYLMAYEGGDPSNHDHEVQEARWLPLTEGDRLAFPTERSLIGKTQHALSHGATFDSIA